MNKTTIFNSIKVVVIGVLIYDDYVTSVNITVLDRRIKNLEFENRLYKDTKKKDVEML